MALRVSVNVLATLLAFAALTALIRDTAYNGHDFEVFWRAASDLRLGEPVYSTLRDGAMVFKYPPWILPFFLPLSVFPLELAKWIWGFIEIASLLYCFRWTIRRARCDRAWVTIVAVSFWGLWAVHALDGQVALPMLALALAFAPGRKKVGPTLCRLTALSTKVFTLFPTLLESPSEIFRARVLACVAVLWAALSIPALWASPGHSVRTFLVSYVDAASSAARLFGDRHAGAVNSPSLAAFLRDHGAWPAAWAPDFALPILLGALIALVWFRARWISKLDAPERWACALALAPVVHPLPWWHLFVFAFPLAAVAVDRAFCSPSRWARVTAALGVFYVAMATEKSVGTWLCLPGIGKSLGIGLLILSLHESQKVPNISLQT